MKLGLPWNGKDVRPDARETAQEAARRAGLPLNEWLNTAILHRAAEQGVRFVPAQPRHGGPAEEYSKLLSRLDDLTRRFEQSARSGASARQTGRERPQADTFTDAIDRLEFRLRQITDRLPDSSPPPTSQLPPNLERAIAEFTSRRHALNEEHHYDRQRKDIPSQTAGMDSDYVQKFERHAAGVDAQLRRITEDLAGFKPPAIEPAIEALRDELGAIGRTLTEAMPRQAIESIERQIQDLTRRVMDNRDAGSDHDALSGVEPALAEIRDALRTLAPAESLLGYDKAIAELGRKLDLIVAEKDPATLQQLDRAIVSLRELSANVASSAAIDRLANDVRLLSEKVDFLSVGSGVNVLDNLQERIEILTRALSARTEAEAAAPTRLENLMQSLSDRIEQLQKSDSGHVASAQLEDRIVSLMSRLDASASRLGQLDAIERGIADLLVAIEELRADKATLRGENPAQNSPKREIAQSHGPVEKKQAPLGDAGMPPIGSEPPGERATPADIQLSREFAPAPSENAAARDESRQTPLPPVPLDEALRATVASLAAAAPLDANQIWPTQSSPAANVRADEPLEPGSGPPRLALSPGNRIAASEAILAGVRPPAVPPVSKSNFIAAARRAAQAAGQDTGGRTRRAERTGAANPTQPPRDKATAPIKSLFVAMSVVAIVVGATHYVGHLFDFGIFDTKDKEIVTSSGADSEASEPRPPGVGVNTDESADEQAASAENEAALPADSNMTASLLAPSALPSLPSIPERASPQVSSPGSAAPALNAAPPAGLLVPPALSQAAPATRKSNDVTGSIGRAPAENPARRQAEPSQQPGMVDQLPAGIAGPQLRNAAIAGDAGAAYEIALRFVEARGVPANLEEAARWFERAAAKGLAPAQFRYASMLEKGQGVKKDPTAAQKLYIAAAGKGHAKAMHNLAVLYAEGIDGKPDYSNAAQWFRKAAELGVADSQYNLGVLAARGLGTERNIAESYKWFALAAAQGDREATRKRDEVATHLDAQTLAAAQQAVKSFVPAVQPATAITVPAPPGGWDRTTQSERPRTGSPLSISAFNSGKL